MDQSESTKGISRRTFVTVSAATLVTAGAGFLTRSLWTSSPASAPLATNQAAVTDSIASMAGTLGRDLRKIFAFVQQEIRYEPYAGILRGARGTLLTRAGNSADRALLLAELLRASSIPARFVSGPLEASAADRLLATTEVTAAQAQERRDSSIMPADLQDAFVNDVKTFGPQAVQHLQSSVAMLTKAMTSAGLKPTAGIAGLPALERTAHTWVQARDGESWIDLDPSFRDTPAGSTVATPESPVETLADDLRYRVTFAVVAESFVESKLSQEVIFRTTMFADELARQNILFTHVPAASLSGINILGSGQSKTKRYNPVLLLGSDAHIGRKPIVIATGKAATDTIADAFGGGGSDTGLSEGEASGEWLEVQLTPPGQQPILKRRAIFDRIGFAARQTGALNPDAVPLAELHDMKDGEGTHYLPCRSMWAFCASTGAADLTVLRESAASARLPPLSLIPAAFDVLHRRLDSVIAQPAARYPFTDSPNIASLVLEAGPDGYTRGLDIWHRRFGTTGVRGLAPATPPAMTAGVFAHVVERLVLGDDTSRDNPHRHVSVGAVFETATAQGITARAFSHRFPDDVELEPDHRARIQLALDAGLIVVSPGRAVDINGRPRLGWWLIDPATGAAVDEMDDGRGGTNDYVVVIPAAGALGAGVANYGWHVLNLGMKYAADPKISRAMSRLFDALMAMTPPGGSGGS